MRPRISSLPSLTGINLYRISCSTISSSAIRSETRYTLPCFRPTSPCRAQRRHLLQLSLPWCGNHRRTGRRRTWGRKTITIKTARYGMVQLGTICVHPFSMLSPSQDPNRKKRKKKKKELVDLTSKVLFQIGLVLKSSIIDAVKNERFYTRQFTRQTNTPVKIWWFWY